MGKLHPRIFLAFAVLSGVLQARNMCAQTGAAILPQPKSQVRLYIPVEFFCDFSDPLAILMDYVLRKANLDDREAIEELIAESARGLSRQEYSERQIEAAIASVFGVDTNLILDETYFVADSSGVLLGCGGWSRRKTLFGGDQYASRDSGELDPKSEAAKIRAFFVHPAHARKGVGRAILLACEGEARAFGFVSVELMATLPGIPFYKTCGYRGDEVVEIELLDGVRLELVPMRKDLC